MRRENIRSTIFILLALFVFVACMNNKNLDPDIQRYSNIDEILNPPDEFQLVYILNTYNNYKAIIEFEDNAVWEIVRLTVSGFNSLKVERSDGTTIEAYDIIDPKTDTCYVGFEGGISYDFVANRSAGENNSKTFLLQFTKQTIPYETFTPRI